MRPGRLSVFRITAGLTAVAASFACGSAVAHAAIDFGPPQSRAAGVNPTSMASGDFNNDGSPDLAVVNFDGDADAIDETSVSILTSDGLGGFSKLDIPLSSQGDVIVAARVDSDTDLDLVIGTLGGQIRLLRGSTGSTFLPAQVVDSGQPGPREVAVGDVSGDKKADIVASTENSKLVVLKQKGDATFPKAKAYGGGGGPATLVKLDRKNGLDVVVVKGASKKVSTFVSRKGGRLKKTGSVKAPTVIDSSLSAADLDGNGKQDVFGTGFEPGPQDSNELIVFPGSGTGKLRAIKRFDVRFSTARVVAARGFSGDGPADAEAADLNGDGVLDVVVPLGGADRIAVLLGKQSGIAYKDAKFFPTGPRPDGAEVTQLDGQAGLDVAFVRDGGDVGLLFQE